MQPMSFLHEMYFLRNLGFLILCQSQSHHHLRYVESKTLLSIHQLDFPKGRSMEDQLLVTSAEVVDAEYRGMIVDKYWI